MPPLVSILIPAYNAESSLGDTIRSALAQSWARKEIVIVDDGSTDGTLGVARSFASATVRVVHQPNQGSAPARNTAFGLAQGDYIQWLDADDLLSVDKIALQMRVLQSGCSPRTLASCAWGYFRYRPWKARFTPGPLWHDLPPIEWMLRKQETNSHMQTATWLTSRQLLEDAGPWDVRMLVDDDGELFARVVAQSDAIRFVPGARVYYRISPSTRVSYIGTSDAKLESQLLAMELQIGYLRALRDDERARKSCTTYLETWLSHFHPHRPDLVERMQRLARSWGGELRTPRLSWKYQWIGRLFGSDVARRAQLGYNEIKSRAIRTADRMLLGANGGTVDVSGL